ncbi:hypothetical protein A3860_05120 [Niastella vici]|uniref:Carrier domain-containing protein n=1 Tax=Niastella vici TaxID=1703345 RepID=A0A1V9FRX8_9BACT|nr:non-ribosomal peptide synthetase [Niastella vici]OQP61102.1 hypothetical protein A3860_05120 [Niastella vici]
MEQLLKKLKTQGIKISVQDGNLKIKFIGDKLPDDIMQEIKDNKPALIEYLKNIQRHSGTIPSLTAQPDYALSSSQRRLWIVSRLVESNAAYNMHGAMVFKGRLDVGALENAFRLLIERHEILRTVFRENAAGEVRQIILPAAMAGFKLFIEDATLQQDKTQYVRDKVDMDLARPFDLSAGPLLRVTIFRMANDEHVCCCTLHHIICDGWSMELLFREMLVFYRAAAAGEKAALAPLRIQYKDYAAWQQEQMEENILADHRKYWIDLFSDSVPVLQLGDKPRPQVKTYNGMTSRHSLNPEKVAQFGSLCQEEGSTLFMGLVAIVNVLLHRYTNQTDITTGSSIAGREDTELEEQIGYYANVLPLRNRFRQTDSFRELLSIVKEATLKAYTHQRYPFDQLVDELGLQRDPGRNPLFDVMIDYTEPGNDAWEKSIEGLEIRPYTNMTKTISKFDLTFSFTGDSDGLVLAVEYNTDLFGTAMIKQLCGHFDNLFAAVVQDPAMPVNRLKMLTTGDIDTLLYTFNRVPGELASREVQAYTPVIALFESQAMRTPDRTAIVYQEETLTYRELNDRVSRLAAYLQRNFSIQPGNRIGVMADRCSNTIIALLAILKSGCAYVPIDPDYPQSRKRYIMKDARLDLLITESDHLWDLDYFDGVAFAIDKEPWLAEDAASIQDRLIAGDAAAYLIYTSGSTGDPKGCSISNHSFSNYIQWANGYYFGAEMVPDFGLFTSLSFDLTITSIFCTLTSGGRLGIFPQREAIVDILRQYVEGAFSANCIKLTPSHIDLLSKLSLTASSIKCAIVGGEEMTARHVAALKKLNPSMKIYNEYGPTETTVGCMVMPLEEGQRILIGKPIDNMRIYIFGNERRLEPAGVAGEICVGGAGVGMGYLNQSRLTEEKFIEDPYRTGERIYRTGDLGRWLPDGDLEFLGRKDDQVKIRGYRIEPGEIEAALCRHREVELAVVAAETDESGDLQLVAYVAGDMELDASMLVEHLNGLLPAYMIPMRFVQVQDFPISPNGKVDRKQLRHAAGRSLDREVVYEAPRNPTEEQLAAIWKQVLGREMVGIRDNFFEIGGNSLKAARLMELINRAFPMNISLPMLFKYPNIYSLAEYIVTAGEAEVAQPSENELSESTAIIDRTLHLLQDNGG